MPEPKDFHITGERHAPIDQIKEPIALDLSIEIWQERAQWIQDGLAEAMKMTIVVAAAVGHWWSLQ